MKPKSENAKKKKKRVTTPQVHLFFFLPFRLFVKRVNGPMGCRVLTSPFIPIENRGKRRVREENVWDDWYQLAFCLCVCRLVKYCPSHGTMPPGFLSQISMGPTERERREGRSFLHIGGLVVGDISPGPSESGSPSFFLQYQYSSFVEVN